MQSEVRSRMIRRVDLLEKDLEELRYYLYLQSPTARALRTLDTLRKQIKELPIEKTY